MPAYMEKHDLNVYINTKEQQLPSIPFSNTWNEALLQIPSTYLQEGVNNIIIECSVHYNSEQFLETVKIETAMDSFFPVLGEIHAFTIQTNS
jgi:hypothetical protein